MSFRPIFKGYKITFKKSARKELDALPKEIAAKINEKLDDLVAGKEGLDVKKLKDYRVPTYRVAVNEYRAIFEPYDNTVIIFVINVLHRKDCYHD